jgi:phage terminase large subunit-like protein
VHVNDLLALIDGVPDDVARDLLRGAVSRDDALELLYSWRSWARPNQLGPVDDVGRALPPASWRWWLIKTGRGWGKTRTAAEWVRSRVERGVARNIALIAQDPDGARVMISGRSGLETIAPPDFRPVYTPTTKTLVWPNGAVGSVYSAADVDALRGPEFDTVWIDEFAAMRAHRTVWANANFSLRQPGADGSRAQGVITTTPRPLPMVRELLKKKSVRVTHGSTYENEENLEADFISEIEEEFGGTRLGRQELLGEVLVDVEGALWQWTWIEGHRVAICPELVYKCIAVDPAASSGPLSSECGIVGVGRGADGDGYVFADQSAVLTPKGWGQRVVDLYWEHECNEVIAEVNNGGEMVKQIIADIDPRVPVEMKRASTGKKRRAEPVANLYEPTTMKPCRMHHVGMFPALEDQMTQYTGASTEKSPDRLDALVWGTFASMLDEGSYVDFA